MFQSWIRCRLAWNCALDSWFRLFWSTFENKNQISSRSESSSRKHFGSTREGPTLDRRGYRIIWVRYRKIIFRRTSDIPVFLSNPCRSVLSKYREVPKMSNRNRIVNLSVVSITVSKSIPVGYAPLPKINQNQHTIRVYTYTLHVWSLWSHPDVWGEGSCK